MLAARSYVFEPIGFARSPFKERVEAPRQPSESEAAAGTLELIAGRGYEHALEGIELWDRIWVLFVFHKNVEEGRGWRARVLPPRSDRRQGLFATRSPHRPNPIGMSVLRLDRVEGLSVHVRGVDFLDGTPVLDIKPYVPYADAHPDASSGWLETRDPVAAWAVVVEDEALAQLAFLCARGVDLEPAMRQTLSLGPAPHPYRRIREREGGYVLSIKDWRVAFAVDGRTIHVTRIRTGYRAAQLERPALELHREFARAWT
jgi:tRNA-Thr(GGU) m(6)t(6)A37 methyltransferase TsaA